MSLRTPRVIIAAAVAELVAVLAMMLPGIIVFAAMNATVVEKMLSMQRLALCDGACGGLSVLRARRAMGLARR